MYLCIPFLGYRRKQTDLYRDIWIVYNWNRKLHRDRTIAGMIIKTSTVNRFQQIVATLLSYNLLSGQFSNISNRTTVVECTYKLCLKISSVSLYPLLDFRNWSHLFHCSQRLSTSSHTVIASSNTKYPDLKLSSWILGLKKLFSNFLFIH